VPSNCRTLNGKPVGEALGVGDVDGSLPAAARSMIRCLVPELMPDFLTEREGCAT